MMLANWSAGQEDSLMPRLGNGGWKLRIIRWTKRLVVGSILTFAAVFFAARVGVMPSAGYEILYTVMISTGEHFGASHERVVLGLHEANCRLYRIPRPIRWLANDGLRHVESEGLNRLFTCSAETPLQIVSTLMTGSR